MKTFHILVGWEKKLKQNGSKWKIEGKGFETEDKVASRSSLVLKLRTNLGQSTKILHNGVELFLLPPTMCGVVSNATWIKCRAKSEKAKKKWDEAGKWAIVRKVKRIWKGQMRINLVTLF